MISFEKFLLEATEKEQEKAFIDAIRSGDRAAFNAYVDFLQDAGREVPEVFFKWLKLPVKMSPPYHIRFGIKRDVPEILAIEQIMSDNPILSENEIINIIRSRNAIAYVCLYKEDVIGYDIIRLARPTLSIVKMAVHPFYVRSGIGRALVEHVKSKTHQNRPNIEVSHSPEVSGFFNKLGFINNPDNKSSIFTSTNFPNFVEEE